VSEIQPTALSAVFRRISHDTPAPPPAAPSPDLPSPVDTASEWVPEFHGFPEPEPLAPPPPVPPPPHLAHEDVDALLREQPELAPPIEIDASPADDAPANDFALPGAPDREPEPESPRVEPSPSRVIRLQDSIGRFNRSGPAPLVRRVAQPKVQAEVELPEPPPAPDAPLSVPHPAPPPAAAPDPAEPAPTPIEAAPAPAMDRVGRQALAHNRRLYRRVRLGAEIEIDGQKCNLIDVSIGGFGATEVPDIRPNTVVPVTLRLSIDGIEVGTRLDARIIYVTRGRSSGKFIEPSASQTAFLRYIVTWRGESVGTVGTTTLLDTITGGPDHSYPRSSPDRLNGPKERWWTGLIGKKISPPR
jgi:hypothetical protein